MADDPRAAAHALRERLTEAEAPGGRA